MNMNIENHQELQPGQITLANTSRFDEAYLSEPLTAYAVGWSDDGVLQADLDFVAPSVLVPRRFEYRKADNNDEFLEEKEDIRAIGADFRRVEPSGEIVLNKTYNKGLTMRVDLDQVSGILNWRQLTVAKLLRRLLRAELKRAITLLYDSATVTSVTWASSGNGWRQRHEEAHRGRERRLLLWGAALGGAGRKAHRERGQLRQLGPVDPQ